jgi:hypothetical protein
VLVNGFIAFWPLRLTFRALRELPVKVGNMMEPRRRCGTPRTEVGGGGEGRRYRRFGFGAGPGAWVLCRELAADVTSGKSRRSRCSGDIQLRVVGCGSTMSLCRKAHPLEPATRTWALDEAAATVTAPPRHSKPGQGNGTTRRLHAQNLN